MKKITIVRRAAALCSWRPWTTRRTRSNGDDHCSNADLKGTYSFVASGTFGGAAFATAGQTTYDGHGNAAG